MTGSFEIVEYAPAFKSSVLSLLSHLWGGDETSRQQLFAWKHESNPYTDRPRLFLAVERERVIGMRGLFGSLWHVGPEQAKCLCLADSVVAPSARRRGIAKDITHYMFAHVNPAECARLLTLSPSLMTKRIALSLGGCEVTTFGMARRRESAATIPPRSDVKTTILDGLGISVESSPRPQAMADLIERLPRRLPISHVRDATYFRWRFRNPCSRYLFFFLGADPLEGYLVVQCGQRNGELVGRIMDWEATREDALAVLLRAVIEQRLANRLGIWTTNFGDARKKLLAETGFELNAGTTSNAPGLLVNQLGGNPLDLAYQGGWLDAASWDLRMLYADGY